VRVRFGDLAPPERQALEALDQRAREAFAASRRAGTDAHALRVAFERVHPGLSVERFDQGLIVRARSRELCPLAERVAKQAPPNLTVHTHRPRLAWTEALTRAESRGGPDFRGARVRAGFTRGHLLELVVSVPGGKGDDAERELAERLVWDIAGERRADDWIGGVEVEAAPRGGPLRVLHERPDDAARLPLSELSAALDAAISGVEAGLPEAPLHDSGDGEWNLFELDPETAGDYPQKDDLVMAVTRVPELLKCFLEASPVSSLRFSRHERFFFLKYESNGHPESRLAERETLERALDRYLIAGRAGRVVGGGLGLRYSYVDVALSKLDQGLALICEAAREEGLPQRSWIECFDSDFADEWLEVWPGAAVPPGQSRGV
jgi:hypothetical protein